MKPEARTAGIFQRLFILLLFSFLVFAGSALAQKTTASLVGFNCLKKKWPDVSIDHRSKMVFVPETGQNLAWDKDKQAWTDVKTGQPVWGDCRNLSEACWHFLKSKWPDVSIDHQSKMAFVPETGQNLAWDKEKQAWVDVKTGKCICPECEEKRTAHAPPPTPTPSTTDKVTDVLKTIGSSVSVSIGGGGYTSGHNERHHGEDRHRTADKVSTDKTKTHTTSPTTTHKTVTSACKCHPCTCSPCTCH